MTLHLPVPFTRVVVFLALNERTAPHINELVAKFQDDFDGCTYTIPAKPTPFWGRWKATGEHIVLFILDIDSRRQINIDNYLLKFKESYETKLGEKEIWTTYYAMVKVEIEQPLARRILEDLSQRKRKAWVSVKALAQKMSVEISDLELALAALEDVGLLVRRNNKCRLAR